MEQDVDKEFEAIIKNLWNFTPKIKEYFIFALKICFSPSLIIFSPNLLYPFEILL